MCTTINIVYFIYVMGNNESFFLRVSARVRMRNGVCRIYGYRTLFVYLLSDVITKIRILVSAVCIHAHQAITGNMSID